MMQSSKQQATSTIKSRKLNGEEFKEAYPGYLLSNKGRWYSLHSKRIMRQNPNSSGYMRVTILLDGRYKHVLTHIKVVELFGDKLDKRIPENAESLRELGLSIDHIDANKKHNSKDNLELVTHVENCLRRKQKNVEKKIGGKKHATK